MAKTAALLADEVLKPRRAGPVDSTPKFALQGAVILKHRLDVDHRHRSIKEVLAGIELPRLATQRQEKLSLLEA